MTLRLTYQGAAAAGPGDRMCWSGAARTRPMQTLVTRAELAGATGHIVLLLVSCAIAAAVQFQSGSVGGPYAYLFLGLCAVTFAVCVPVTRPLAHLTSLRGIIELWFLLDFVLFGTMLCAGLPPKIPLPVPAQDAYSQAYIVGILGLLGFGIGCRLAGPGSTKPAQARKDPTLIGLFVVVFGVFSVLGLVGLAVLLSDPQIREDILFKHFGLAPPPGMGRYSSLFFAFPSSAIALVYLWTLMRPPRTMAGRFAAGAACFLISLVHLAQGRRLMWLCTLLMAGYLLRRSNALRLRWYHLAVVLVVAVPASVFYELNKHSGWMTPGVVDTQTLVDSDQIIETFRNSVGRFDITAALVSSRPEYGYHYGQTFLDSFRHALPTSLEPDRPLGIGAEIGELIYNNFGIHLVTQAGSLVAELHANFGFLGVFLGFLAIGWGASRLDNAADWLGPLGAIGYSLVLFRMPHHLVVASYAATPLTIWAIAPWVACLLLVGVQAVDRLRATPREAVSQ